MNKAELVDAIASKTGSSKKAAEAAAKAYTDTEINTKVIALTTAEIEAAIAAGTNA